MTKYSISKYPNRKHWHHPNMSSVPGCSWLNFILVKELKFGTRHMNHIQLWCLTSKMTPSSNYPFRNHQHPQSMTSKTEFWHTFIHTRELKITQKSWITDKRNPWSHYWLHPQNIQCSKYDFDDRVSLTHLYSCKKDGKNSHTTNESYMIVIHDVKYESIIPVSSEYSLTFFNYDFEVMLWGCWWFLNG